MIRRIEDAFSPEIIRDSGQCFRVRTFPDGTFRFITGRHVLYLRGLGGQRFEVSCGPGEWENVWKPYFALDRNYAAICREAAGRDGFIDAAIRAGEGLRLLRQDPWEMLLTFIISQRKSIPAIAGAVEKLACRWGKPVVTPRETVYAFPTARELQQVTEAELRECSLGYRAPYVLDAVRRVADGTLDLSALRDADDECLVRELQSVRGVGKKVAACVGLFGYDRQELAPVDVWIRRAMEEQWGGRDPFGAYGEAAGLMQQYVFFYMRAGGRRKPAPAAETSV